MCISTDDIFIFNLCTGTVVLFGSTDISIQYVYSVSAIFCMGVCQFQIVWSALIKGQQHEIFSIKIFFFSLSLAYQNDYFVISP